MLHYLAFTFYHFLNETVRDKLLQDQKFKIKTNSGNIMMKMHYKLQHTYQLLYCKGHIQMTS